MTKFTYIYDTYCGWCYGAAPIISQLIEGGADITLLHRHLFQGVNAYRMGDGFGRSARKIDQHIAQLTGQEFSDIYVQNILSDDDEILDSSLTAYAAALVRPLGSEIEFNLARVFQQARFVDGISANDNNFAQQLLSGFGVEDSLKTGVGSAQESSAEAVGLQRRVAARGVPVLLRHQNDRTLTVDVSRYYMHPHQILELLD